MMKFLRSKTKCKYFGIGYPRTGTASLGECFRELGFKPGKVVQHFIEWWQTHKDPKDYARDECFLRSLQEYDLISDWPVFLIYKELDKQYPESKFILTMRENEQVWAHSNHALRLLRQRQLSGQDYKEYLRQREDLPAYDYEKHIREVRDYFKGRPDDLLIMSFDQGDGWEKLCGFLGVPVPQVPVPFLNKGVYV